MIDTLKLETPLWSVNQFYELQNAIIKIFGETDKKHHLQKCEDECNQHQTVWSTAGFYPHGVLQLSVRHKFYPDSISVIAKYKPAIILHDVNSETALSKMTDYEPAVVLFNDFVDIINSQLDSYRLPPAIFWDVTRVDYAYQFTTPFYEPLLYILNKGFAIAKNLGYKTSAYYVNTCRNINIYDKTVEQNPSTSEEEHLLRFEVQCKRKSLNHIAERYQWERISIFHVWNENIAKDTVVNTVKMLVGQYDFFNLDMAEEVVRNTYRTKKADNILHFLKKTRYNKAKLKNLLSKKMDGYSKDYIRRSVRPALNKAGIAPVLIPDRYHISILENPIVQLQRL